MDFPAAIDAARAENSHGVQVRRGKNYTTVAVRVEIARRHFGAIGIATEVIQWATDNGQPIVVKATVTDEAGRVLATGHAEEVRGQGNVNRTSALENAETSAIGRALAALGINGGEFASAEEMTQAVSGEGQQRQAPPQQQEPPESVRDRIKAALDRADEVAQLDKVLGHPATKDALHNLPHDMRGQVLAHADARRKALTPAQESDHVYG